jgi:Zn2+/Cd2+-exporting ATPase
VPLDGRVTAGDSQVNQAPVTGESLPVDKAAGDDVFAGTINGRGALDVVVTRLRGDSTLARIIHMVEHAQSQRAPSQAFVDRFARIYTPIVLAAARAHRRRAAAGHGRRVERLVLPRAGPARHLVPLRAGDLDAGVDRVGAGRRGAQGGAHQGGRALEKLAEVRCIAFDKTGTLTKARLDVVGIEPLGTASAEDVLRIAASLESYSEHPIGQAIVTRALADGLSLLPVQGFRALPGRGAEGVVGSATVWPATSGSRGSAASARPDMDQAAARLAATGCSTVFVAAGESVLGVIGVADQPRESARDAIELLRGHGIRHVVMLTGDHDAAAKTLAASLGVDSYRAELLPEDKVDAVHELRREHGALAMIGDGVNDAPALAASDVGIAMGVAGTDAALETADVALMADELLKIPYTLRLSRATARNIRANIGFSIVIKGRSSCSPSPATRRSGWPSPPTWAHRSSSSATPCAC